jgi:universal stress protein A
MALYNHILVALDLTEESTQILERATRLGAGSRISLMHVIEPLAYAYGGDIPMDLSEVQNQLQQQATEQLAKLGKSIGVAAEDQYVVIGQPTSEIHRMSEEKDVDLIVVGSHGRQGLALLLGSTANGVLHGTKCDVLAVRVDQQKQSR